ncbi:MULTISPECIES: ABC transporter permease [Paraburkholderia]|jgi:histidine transport system permease protein/arginine/ornithine transport system permease protein|uniref:Amino acid ABC transporter permease n=2 Tax=Paraburkholderia TaxID=1822464 RepID=A0A4R0XH33_9BURK|nr:ABC transporter permease [Paraburkholderia hospita]TCG09863.1 amino acid ABC transporter permease [Paraburkholderia steynii]SKC90296.1 histidine transport system permease protein/arginine/ornithine transport system permease protein [Burkholderia sp. CF099]SOE91009.1 histidine transport system permease protein/arginine/ornithine transport system permease protein [Burkholderia sp. YR290]AUT71428.1 amino acid ABC transporter permease [Paraburkholderia hospita]EIM94328.1 polar amino acid ABC tr
MTYEQLGQLFASYASGLWVTVQLTVFSLVLGLLIAIPLAVLRVSPNRIVSGPVAVYTWFMRGTPLLAQLMIVYYGFGQFQWMQDAWQRGTPILSLLRDPYDCALIALTANTCAYTTEILAGALRATPYGEIEAARAYGMSQLTTWRRILLPSALRRFIPAYSNEVILMLHGTSLVSAITIVDLTGVARDFYANYYAPFEAFISVGTVYFGLTTIITLLVRLTERRYLVYLRPQNFATLAKS